MSIPPGLTMLFQATRQLLEETTLEGVAQRLREASALLTGAGLSYVTYGYHDGQFDIRTGSQSKDQPDGSAGEAFCVPGIEKHIARIMSEGRLHLTIQELRGQSSPDASGDLPAGLLGVRMVNRLGQSSGLILVSDKASGDFSEEDEAVLTQLASVASLAMQHVEALTDAQRRADDAKRAEEFRQDHPLTGTAHAKGSPAEKLRDSEANYRQLVEAGRSIVVRLDPEGRITFINEFALKFFGFSPEEVIGHLALETIVPPTESTGRNLSRMVDEIVHEPQKFLYNENENVCKDGRRVWIAWTNQPIFSPDGKLKEILSVGLDATGRRHAEQALNESRDLLALASEAASIGFWHWDKSSGRMKLTEKCAELFGRSDGTEWTNAQFVECLHPDDRARFTDAIAKALSSHQAYSLELRVTRGDETRWMFMKGRGLYDVAGNAWGVVGSVLDTTDRKQAEEALSRAVGDLARSNRDLEQFAYVASHDLQEPLRMVSSFVELLSNRCGDSIGKEANEYMGYVTEGAKRMQALISDLLSYSRVGTHSRSFAPFDTREALDTAMASLSDEIAGASAVVTVDKLPTVMGDSSQWVLLFQNLLSNAIKFHKEGVPPIVHVSARLGGGHWVVCVQDNGIGLDPRDAERVFMIFQRLHSRSQYAGTGIGLAICRKIVERHGGRIWVQSQPGQGASFFFTVPAMEARHRASDARTEVETGF